MVEIFRNNSPEDLNYTKLYVSNDSIRVDGMEYWTAIRAEYSEDDEYAFTIKSEDYETLLNTIKEKYPDYKEDENLCKGLWWEERWGFNELTKKLCMAIVAVFSCNRAYRKIGWLCDEVKIVKYNEDYGWN